MTATAIAELILGVFALAAIGAGVLGYFQSQKSKAIIEIQQQTIDSQKDRLDEYADANVDRDKEFAKLTARLAATEAENRTLREVITARDAIQSLTEMVAGLVSTTSSRYDEISKRQAAILARLEGRA